MKITDKNVLKLLKNVRYWELADDLEEYPEDERDGRSDMQMLADEVSYFVMLHREDDTGEWEALQEARRKLRETKNGKCIPIDPHTFAPLYGYRRSDIERYKDVVNDYNRLKRLLKKLQNEGYYGTWEVV